MNPQEYEALRSLLSQLVEIHGVNKDPEADLLIREAVARQPKRLTYWCSGPCCFARRSMRPGAKLPH